MYKLFFGMEYDPFEPYSSRAGVFESQDFTQATARLEHLKNLRGVGLFTGHPGYGKTAVARNWAATLNPGLFKVVYLPMSSITTIEFYRGLCRGLDLEPKFKKIDMFHDIQQRLISMCRDKKTVPCLILDEAQYLRADILNDLKMILNFEMDSKAYAILILMGLPVLGATLSRKAHEALAQRISINFSFQGLARSEAKEYLTSQLRACGVLQPIFEDTAIEALFSASNGSIRRLNAIASKALFLAAQQKKQMIASELILAVCDDMDFA